MFYSQDFLTGIADLTMEERGQYITLLCLQHQKGGLTEKTIRLAVGNVSVDVIAKFSKNSDGSFFNERLAMEIDRRTDFIHSRRKNGQKGGRPKASAKPNGKPNGKPKNNLPENENENENVIEIEDENTKGGAGGKRVKQAKKAQTPAMPWDEPEFARAWETWKKYKREQFAFTYKPTGEQAALMELANLSGGRQETALAIIRQSMGKGWKGFFELKKTENEQRKATFEQYGQNLEQRYDALFGR